MDPHAPPEQLRHDIFDVLGIEVLVEEVLVEEVLGAEVLGVEVLGVEVLGVELAPLFALHPEAMSAKTITALVQIPDRVRIIDIEERLARGPLET